MKLTSQGFDFTNSFRAALSHEDPKSAQKGWQLDFTFALLESVGLKAARKMLMKLTTQGLHIFQKNSLESELFCTMGFTYLRKFHSSNFSLQKQSQRRDNLYAQVSECTIEEDKGIKNRERRISINLRKDRKIGVERLIDRRGRETFKQREREINKLGNAFKRHFKTHFCVKT